MLAIIVITIVTNLFLFILVPKGFFPEQDTGRLSGTIQAAQDTSFQSMQDFRFARGSSAPLAQVHITTGFFALVTKLAIQTSR
jgi:hypothetical protein